MGKIHIYEARERKARVRIKEIQESNGEQGGVDSQMLAGHPHIALM